MSKSIGWRFYRCVNHFEGDHTMKNLYRHNRGLNGVRTLTGVGFFIISLTFWVDISFTQERLAVFPFKDTSIEDKDTPIVDGIPDMLTSRLAKSQKITLIERTQIDKALLNFKIETSGVVAETTAVEIGQWLGATAIVVGNFTKLVDKISLDARIIDIKTGAVSAAFGVEGSEPDLINMIDDLASGLLKIYIGEQIVGNGTKGIVFERVYSINLPVYDQAQEISVCEKRIEYFQDPDDPSLEFLVRLEKLIPCDGMIYLDGLKFGKLDLECIWDNCSEMHSFAERINAQSVRGDIKLARCSRGGNVYIYHLKLIDIKASNGCSINSIKFMITLEKI